MQQESNTESNAKVQSFNNNNQPNSITRSDDELEENLITTPNVFAQMNLVWNLDMKHKFLCSKATNYPL